MDSSGPTKAWQTKAWETATFDLLMKRGTVNRGNNFTSRLRVNIEGLSVKFKML
jgi:hypothetical protein